MTIGAKTGVCCVSFRWLFPFIGNGCFAPVISNHASSSLQLTTLLLLTKHFHIFGPSLLGAAVGATPVIWQASNNHDRIAEDVAPLRLEIQHVQAIALGSAYVAMKCFSGEKQMNKWMKDLEKCVTSGG